MIRLRVFALLALLAVAGPVLLDGCANKSVTSGGSTTAVPKPRMEERIVAAPVQEIAPPPEAAPVPLRSTEMAARNATGELNIPFPDVLFDFDQYVLRDDALTAVEDTAKRLKDHQVTRVVLEGRCDEIGTAEYNLVLGERRALSVKRYLESLGFSKLQVDVTSYGKDRPLCLQHNPVCWQKNRSVHFIVKD